jgi:hypothetical protein
MNFDALGCVRPPLGRRPDLKCKNSWICISPVPRTWTTRKEQVLRIKADLPDHFSRKNVAELAIAKELFDFRMRVHGVRGVKLRPNRHLTLEIEKVQSETYQITIGLAFKRAGYDGATTLTFPGQFLD